MDSRGAQRGFAVARRATRALISAVTGGRHPIGRPESRVQYARKRCHRVQILASPTQKRRSVVRSRGRVAVLLYTASC